MAVDSGNRRKYSFKSVGESLEEYTAKNQVDVTALPIGIQTPLKFSTDNSGIFQMHHVLLNQVKDNLRNLILTNHGERFGLHDFGANLQPLLFDLGSEGADNEATRRITMTVSKYMPFISLNTFETGQVQSDIAGMSKVNVKITYDVPKIGASNQVLDVILYYGG